MAVSKSLYEAPKGIEEIAEEEEPIEIEVVSADDDEMEMAVVDLDDGSIEEGLAIMDALLKDQGEEFGANLAESLPDELLELMADDLLEGYDSDIQSRAEWEETYSKGLDLLGLKIEERSEPWQGASAVSHPILAEAVVKFQSETMVETFPASGPVKTKIIGATTKEKTESAKRVEDDMNILFTERMTDYRAEHERLLWHLPLAGSAFKKVYYDTDEGMPIAQFVAAEDFVVSYGASSLQKARRYTHRMRMTHNEIRRLQLSGFYRDVDLPDPQPERDEIEDTKDDLTGYESVLDDRYRVLEFHCDLDIEGYEDTDEEGNPTGLELPYVVTVEKSSGTVLSVYRNWREGDPGKKKRIHFSHYTYIPGFGFYGFGLIHLIGGFTKGATSLLRQLVDSGTLANLQGGFKTRGMRMPGGDTPISPGEYRDVDVPTGTIKDNIMSLPYKEPSAVLAGLLDTIVDEARRFASVADINVTDMQPNAPVGSTLAVLERQLKTMTAVQARVHAGMKQEFKLIKNLIRETTPDNYDYDPVGDEGPRARATDYDVVEVIPVSDPNASSMSQRIAQYQAAFQMAQQAPGDFDTKELNRRMLDALGIEGADKICPMVDDLEPMDPVTENMRMLTGEPVKAHSYQDHEAHIQAHMAFGQDPKIQQMLEMQGEAGAAKIAAGMAHINEHLAYAYRNQIQDQLGVALPETMGEDPQKLPPDVEVQISRLVAQAGDRVLGINRTEEQAKQAQQAQQDPVVQQQMHERKMAELELQRKVQDDQRDYQVDMIKALTDLAKVQYEQEEAGARIGAELTQTLLKSMLDQQEKRQEAVEQDARERERMQHDDEMHGFDKGIEEQRERRREEREERLERERMRLDAETARQTTQQGGNDD